jgi:hypothetical protein
MFWASRIRHYFVTHPDPDLDSDPSINKQKSKKTFCDFFFDFLSMKADVSVPSKSNKQKNFFLLASCPPLKKKAGSGSVSQRKGSAVLDPNPYQNVTDPQHWFLFLGNFYFPKTGFTGSDSLPDSLTVTGTS